MAKRKRWRLILGLGAAGIGAGIAVERAVVGRTRRRPDPEAAEALGRLRGRRIGPIASFDGTLLHAEELGSGPALVFVHGYSLNLTSWHYQMREFARDHRLVLYDQRGHGSSAPSASGDWSLDALAKDLDAVLGAVGEPAVVFGHSMGGMTVLKYLELFPEKAASVAGLVLVDTTASDVKSDFPGVRRISMPGLEEFVMTTLSSINPRGLDLMRRRASDLQWLMVRWMGFGSGASPAQVAFVERMLSETAVATWLGLLPAIAGVDVTASLAGIGVPTLVVVGTGDRITPPAASERLAGRIPGAQTAELSGAGHMAMMEAHTAFNARVRAFLAGLGDWANPGRERRLRRPRRPMRSRAAAGAAGGRAAARPGTGEQTLFSTDPPEPTP